MASLALFAVFLVFAALMYARAVPAILAVPAMALSMAVVAGVPWPQLGGIVVGGSTVLAQLYVTLIFGAWLGRVTLDTGIARDLAQRAQRIGGRHPALLAFVLCAVVAVLFVSLSGLGEIIMIGTIVLPILLSLGFSPGFAASLFLGSFTVGFIFNITKWVFFAKFFGVAPAQMVPFAIVLACVNTVVLLVYAWITYRREGLHPPKQSEPPAQDPTAHVPAYALLAPLLPILLYFTLHIDAIAAFALSAIYGALATRPRQAIATLATAAIRGVEDIAPALLLFIGIGMLITATKAPQFAAALAPIASGTWLRNPLAYVTLFGLASPLVLYRGPLNPFGIGIALFSVLVAAHALPPLVLVAAAMILVQVQDLCDPTNTQNVWVATFVDIPVIEITRRMLGYQMVVATAGALAVVLFAGPLTHSQPFASLATPVAAATLPPAPVATPFPGLFSPPQAADHVAVGDDGTHFGRIAAGAVVAALDADRWASAFRKNTNDDARPCTTKSYAAYVRVTSTTFALIQGTSLDIGVALDDCGGWNVGVWHDHGIFAIPSAADARRLARQGVARMRLWALTHPRHAAHLLRDGLSYATQSRPTYYYSLFKTVDGYMRAYVRAGGPAYDAGLRTSDIVNKLDGKYWWDYGTYQTELRAYDGKPHLFQIQRGPLRLNVRLGAPFLPADAQAKAPATANESVHGDPTRPDPGGLL
ncbi:MAG: hypothetical protein ACYDA5_09655 [Vulcanimicrobiaceae bacterium]